MFEDGEVMEYYNSVYLGQEIPEEDFARLQARAEDALMAATFGRLHGCFASRWKDAILKAWCAQVEWLFINGYEASHMSDGGAGFAVGHVTIYGSSAKNSDGVTGGLCKRAIMFLAPTGLLYCGGVMV